MSLDDRSHVVANPGGQPSATAWLGAAALWALVFAGVHVAWAVGSRVVLVDAAAADAAFGQTWFRLYNLVVAGGSLIVAAVALLHLSRHRSPRGRWSTGVLWLAGGLLVLRGVIGLLQLGWLMVRATRRDPLLTWAMDGYMLAGGGLFLMAAMRTRSAGDGARARAADTADRPAGSRRGR